MGRVASAVSTVVVSAPSNAHSGSWAGSRTANELEIVAAAAALVVPAPIGLAAAAHLSTLLYVPMACLPVRQRKTKTSCSRHILLLFGVQTCQGRTLDPLHSLQKLDASIPLSRADARYAQLVLRASDMELTVFE
jgi:hypothetical protein